MVTQFMVIDTAIAWGDDADFETPIRVSCDSDLVIIEPHDHEEPVRIGITQEDWEALDRFVRGQFSTPSNNAKRAPAV